MKHFSLLLFFILLTISVLGQNKIKKPKGYQSVIDEAALLNHEEYKTLSLKLDAFRNASSYELVIITIKSLNGISVEKYSNDLFNSWGIGKKGKDNGVLILVSLSDRKMRIETGYGVEDELTDLECANIIDELMRPYFKKEDYYQGLEVASNYIIKELNPSFASDTYSLKNVQNISKLDLNKSLASRRRDSISPWFLFFLGLALQYCVGWLLVTKSKFVRKKKKLKENLKTLLIMVSVFYIFLSIIIGMISTETKLYNSTVNIILSCFIAAAVSIYFLQLLPKKVGKYAGILFLELYRLFLCSIAAMFFSTLTLFFSDSPVVLLIVFFVFTVILYYLSLTGKLNWLNSGSSTYSSSYRSSSSYSDYSRSSYSDSSYGGGSSGGGGASGSW